jgi:signal transduction histidine kinase/DNA-binding response OmpR family regulator
MEINYSGAKKKNILVVEDEQIIAEDISYRLNSLGYNVIGSVCTGEDAVKISGEKKPDLILMDIVLKGEMDGIKAHEVIKEKYKIPVIFLTSFSDEVTFARAKHTQPFGYIIKPFEERELRSSIEIALYKNAMDIKLEKTLKIQELISNISRRLLGLKTGELDKGLNESLKRIGEFTKEERIYIYLYNKPTDTFTLTHEWYASQNIKDSVTTDMKIFHGSDLHGILQHFKKSPFLCIPDIDKIPENGLEKAILKNHSAVSVFFIALKSGDNVIGFVGFDSITKIKTWDDSDIMVLDMFGEIIVNTLFRKQIEDQLVESEKNLRELNASKDKFFSIISHDLKNPFMGLLGFTEILYDSFDQYSDEEKKKMLLIIKNSTRTTFKLLENLLEWSRIKIGAAKASPKEQDASILVNDCIFLLRDTAILKNIKILTEVPFDSKVYCDENMVKTILRNFISNAIKFSHPGSTVKIYSSNEEGRINISVSDTGIGISEDVIENLFRIDASTVSLGTQGEKGTGIGLILCKELAEKNGGEIHVQSKKESGSVFTVSIPAKNP